jgi:hypothetical protein
MMCLKGRSLHMETRGFWHWGFVPFIFMFSVRDMLSFLFLFFFPVTLG